MNKDRYTWEDLLAIMQKLRSKDGCPWDVEQTHKSLKKYLLEETYEVLDAIDQGQSEPLCEELGDLMLQIVFHAQIAKENASFAIDDVIHGVAKKMVDRHPHVFGDETCKTAEDVVQKWESWKQKEKGSPTQQQILNDIPKNLPALIRALKIQQKASIVGFDWSQINDVWKKISEEMHELEEAISTKNTDNISEELGDTLFAFVNLARFLKIHPEFALTQTNEKFIRRFSYIENRALEENKKLEEMSLIEMDILWDEAKKVERSASGEN